MLLKFQVTGMTCAACSARVEKVVSQVEGVQRAEVNLLAGKLAVESDKDRSSEIIQAIRNAGYDASRAGAKKAENTVSDDPLREMKTRLIVSGFFLVILMYFTMGHMLGIPTPHWYHQKENAVVVALLQLFLTLPPVFVNRVYYTKGLKALWLRAPNMDTLIAMGSGVSLCYGIVVLFRMAYAMGHGDWDAVKIFSENLYFESAAMILTLITLGKFLETRAKGKTGDAIRQLMDLNPKTATVRVDGTERTIPVDEVKVGDVVIVRSGSRIPVDGTVLSGRADVDQSALTGESVPVEKAVSDSVSAATILTGGYLELKADRVGEDTSLAQIIRMVEDAGGSKAPIARLADKIAGIFVPVVMSISFAAFLVWMLVGQTLEFSLTTAIAVLVISCPCALGLATPVAIMVGTGRAAGMGVLFKNAESLENLHRVNTVVLDKTGTLTTGKPAVTDVLPGSFHEDKLLQLAASMEARSEHPFAKAIMEKYGDGKLDEPEAFETLPGRGVCAIIRGVKYYGGNRRLMEEVGVSVPEYPDLARQGKTPLFFASEDQAFCGAIAAADVMREDTAAAIAAMKKDKLEVVMLTGDNKVTAAAIAQDAGIDRVIADVLPGDKAAHIKKLQNEGRNVLMVGDGINDAPALATANVGMAVGAGTDIAIESADVVLVGHSLAGVARSIELSRATMRNIRQNLFWAFFYNCLCIPVAAGVLYPAFRIQLSPMLGAAAMSMSSVFVVGNALRLRFFKPKNDSEGIKEIEVIKEETKMEVTIKVEGMMCTHCKARVESVCKAVEGAQDAVVDLEAKQVTVSGNASVEALKQTITDAGYEVIG